MRELALTVATVAALAGFSTNISAQINLAAGGGPSYPLGDLGEDFNTGWHIQAMSEVRFPLIPIGLRIDADYNRFPIGSESFQTFSGSINAIVNVPSVGIVPYVLGGLGVYDSRVSEPGLTAFIGESTDIGGNVGAGVRVSVARFALFLEARIHNVFTDETEIWFAPFSVGVRF